MTKLIEDFSQKLIDNLPHICELVDKRKEIFTLAQINGLELNSYSKQAGYIFDKLLLNFYTFGDLDPSRKNNDTFKNIIVKSCANSLNDLSEFAEREHIKIRELNSIGINMVEFDDPLIQATKELISIGTGAQCEDIDWWLYDKVDKVYFIKDADGESVLSVEKAEDFLNYYVGLLS